MGPLAGTLVLDISRYGPGRYCSMILADLGAEVITVEAPRRSLNLHSVMSDDLGFRHLGQNRNKKSIALDLKMGEGKEIFYRLAERSDVVIETFRPGVVKRLGVDYETLSNLNPRVVYCSLTGYGQDGPYAQRPGHDINFAGMAGILSISGSSSSPPMHLPFQIGDMAVISHATIAILASLLVRDQIGRGQYIDASMVDGIVFHLWHYAMMYFGTGATPGRSDLPTGSDQAWMNVYQAKDGKYLTLSCMEPSFWANLCRALDREDLIPYQFESVDKQKEMYEALSEVFATRDRDEWVKLADDADVPIGPVYTIDEVFADPHLKHRKAVVEVEHPRLGKIKLLNTPFKLSETPAEVKLRPPLWGEHTREVLSEFLGYGEEKINHLFQKNVIE
jgi:crotonobetainyl-CoA:carnitine CoA-transferase CaiB-like acyl-CoA transferase